MEFCGSDLVKWMPHGHCISYNATMIWQWVAAGIITLVSYLAIPAMLWAKFKHSSVRPILPYLVPFVVACGTLHGFDVVTIFKPLYTWLTIHKDIVALVSAASAIGLWFELKKLDVESMDRSIAVTATLSEAQRFVDDWLPNVCFICDHSGNDLAVNDAYLTTLQRSIDEVQGIGYLSFVADHQRIEIGQQWLEFCRGEKKKFKRRFLWRTKTTWIWLEVEGKRRPSGQPYGIVHDVTTLVNAEEQLKQWKHQAAKLDG